MKLVLILFFFLNYAHAALDTGTGANGTCPALNTIAPASATYNCTILTINVAAVVTGTNPLIIKVQGDVTITGAGSISVKGADGAVGNLLALTPGAAASPGGYAGGSSTTTNRDAISWFDGEDGSDNANGGKGGGGTSGSDGVGTEIGAGGGGGGGRYGTSSLPGAGSLGVSSALAALNGAAGNAGASSYGTESSFETTLLGGSGGGAGGDGDDQGTQNFAGSGGAGGGIIKIVSGGTITITGTLNANGGNGGNGGATLFGGGGGGGSGGTIFLQAENQIIITGTLSATGGTGGVGGTGNGTQRGGNAGNGGSGRIRIDDLDGTISGGGTVTPTAYTTALAANSTSALKPNFDSTISCSRVNHENTLLYLVAFIFLISLIPNFSKRKTQN